MGDGKRRGKSKPPRNDAERARDLKTEARLYLRGWSQADIAEHLGVDRSTVTRDLQSLHEQWQQEALKDIDQVKQLELARIDRLEREHWDAWERSKMPAEGEQEAIAGPGGFVVTLHSRRGQVGDARFLNGALDCVVRRCAILGIDAPKKIAPTDPSGKQMAAVLVYLPGNDRGDREGDDPRLEE